jgi:hypothetical protein
MDQQIIERRSIPNEYDQLAHGTICKVIIGIDGEYELYQQCSEDENYPHWERISKIN